MYVPILKSGSTLETNDIPTLNFVLRNVVISAAKKYIVLVYLSEKFLLESILMAWLSL